MIRKIEAIFIIFLICTIAEAQENLFKRINFGATVQYLKTSGDLQKYWGNAFAGGVLVKLNIEDDFAIEGGIIGTYLKPVESNKLLPNIIFLNAPLGLKYMIELNKMLKANIWAGIQNHTFVYSGEETELLDDNDIEHEIGFFLQTGIEFIPINSVGVEVYAKVQNVFTEPEQLSYFSFGISIYFY